MSEEISEYQKVAAIVCWDIDIVLKAAEIHPEKAIDLIKALKKNKDKAITDDDFRDMRYSATGAVINFMNRSHKE